VTAARIVLDRIAHIPECERVVARERSLEERAGRGRIDVPASDEHGRERRADPELVAESAEILG
jgi:hypothetical protein